MRFLFGHVYRQLYELHVSRPLGVALPGNGTVLATDPRRRSLYTKAAKRIVEMAKAEGPKPRDLITISALDNAFALDMAMGGSTNTVLHALAIAHEAGVQYESPPDLTIFPNVVRLSARLRLPVYITWRTWNAPAVLASIIKTIQAIPGLIYPEAPTVTGRTLMRNVSRAKVLDAAVIRPLDNPYSPEGGLTILWGNLASEGAVVKAAGVAPSMRTFEGRAVIFNSQEEACAGILAGKVKAGHVVVIRYEGPRGRSGHAGNAGAHVLYYGPGG